MIISKQEALVKRPSLAGASTMRIAQVFLNADLRGSHDHLIAIGKQYKLALLGLAPNVCVIFINRRRTLMKAYFAGNTFSFTRRDRIDLEVIEYLPKTFGISGKWSYDDALKTSLQERLSKRQISP